MTNDRLFTLWATLVEVARDIGAPAGLRIVIDSAGSGSVTRISRLDGPEPVGEAFAGETLFVAALNKIGLDVD